MSGSAKVAPADVAKEEQEDTRSFLTKLIDEQKNWEPSREIVIGRRCCGCGGRRSESSELFRAQLYDIFEEPMSSFLAMGVSCFIMTLIAISILCFILQSEESIATFCWTGGCAKDVFNVIEAVCTIAFTVEFVSRFCVCDVYGESVKDFVKHPLNVFDFLAILPWYIDMLGSDLAGLRIIRLARVLRLLKVARYSSGLQTMIEGLRRSMQAISLLMAAVVLGMILSSSMIYNVEHRSNKEFFPSIPGSFWWALVTMTTVGYGDRYPKTNLGKLVASVTMIFGILLIALPMAIVGNKFQEVYLENMAQNAHKTDPNRLPAGPLTQAYMAKQDSRKNRASNFRRQSTSLTTEEEEEGKDEKEVTIEQFTQDVKDLVGLSVEMSSAMRDTFASAASLPPLTNALLDLLSLPVADGTGGTGAESPERTQMTS
jgi:hypothetical protein